MNRFFCIFLVCTFFCWLGLPAFAGWINSDPSFKYAFNEYIVNGYNGDLSYTDNYLDDLPYGLDSCVLEVGLNSYISGPVKRKLAFVFDKNDFISDWFYHKTSSSGVFNFQYSESDGDGSGTGGITDYNFSTNRLASMLELLNGSDKDVWTYYANITGSQNNYSVTVKILSQSPILLYDNSGDLSMIKGQRIGDSTSAASLLNTISSNASDYENIQSFSTFINAYGEYDFYYYEAQYNNVEYIAYNRLMLNPSTLVFSVDDWSLKASTPCYFVNYPVRNDFKLDGSQYVNLKYSLDHISVLLTRLESSFNSRISDVLNYLYTIDENVDTLLDYVIEINTNLQDFSSQNHEDIQTIVSLLSDLLSYNNSSPSGVTSSSTVPQSVKDYFGSSFDVVVPAHNQNLMAGMSVFKQIFESFDISLSGVLTIVLTLIFLISFIGYVLGRRINKGV